MKIFFLLMLLPFYGAAQMSSDLSLVARAFINSLSSQQKAKTLFAFNDISRFNWHYFPSPDRE